MNTGFAGDGKFAIARRASAVSALEFAPGAKIPTRAAKIR